MCLRLNKLSLERGRELGVVEHSGHDHVSFTTFRQTKCRNHGESVISIACNGSICDSAGEIAPESRESPFAACYRRSL